MGKGDKFTYEDLCSSCKTTSCCEDDIDAPPVFPNDLVKLKEIGKDTDEFLDHFDLGNGLIWTSIKKESNSKNCIFFNQEKRQCKIYEHRPFDCQMYPFDVSFVNDEPWWIVYSCNPNSNWTWTEEYLQKFENDPRFFELMEKIKHYYLYVKNGHDNRSRIETPIRKVNWMHSK